MGNAWAKSAELRIDEEGEPFIPFFNVPVGNERLIVTVSGFCKNEFGKFAFRQIWLSKPINARRLKALPLQAIRDNAERLFMAWVQENDKIIARGVLRVVGLSDEQIDEAVPEQDQAPANELAILASSDRHSDEFLAEIAKISREARNQGRAAWKAVRDALQGKPKLRLGEVDRVGQASAQRYIARADERAKRAKTKREAAKFNTGTLRRAPNDKDAEPPQGRSQSQKGDS